MPHGRFAPSPTGPLHLGGARTALVAWLAARADGSSFVLRMEDLDRPRVVPGAAAAIVEDLRWLGLNWDEGPVYQSNRLERYEAALRRLEAGNHVFACYCSRAEVARAASAPHAGEDGPRYPGTCRWQRRPGDERAGGAAGRLPSLRLRVEPGDVCFDDRVHGRYCQDVSQAVGDFVLRRADGLFAYQLAVVVDDIEMVIEQVVRGDDLLSSTPRQLLLYAALGSPPPAFAHVPLLLGPDGQRLSKRHSATAIGELRDAGVPAAHITGGLGASLGLCPPGVEVTPRDLIAGFSFDKLAREPAVWPLGA